MLGGGSGPADGVRHRSCGYADCTGGGYRRTGAEGAFAVENTGGRDWYTMALSHPRYVEEGETSSGCALLNLPNGGSQAMVIFSQPSQAPFLSRESAQAWTTTEQYGQLKSLLLSLSYS